MLHLLLILLLVQLILLLRLLLLLLVGQQPVQEKEIIIESNGIPIKNWLCVITCSLWRGWVNKNSYTITNTTTTIHASSIAVIGVTTVATTIDAITTYASYTSSTATNVITLPNLLMLQVICQRLLVMILQVQITTTTLAISGKTTSPTISLLLRLQLFGWVLWHINHCWLCNAKSSLYIYAPYPCRAKLSSEGSKWLPLA